jgi:hypothetical protein
MAFGQTTYELTLWRASLGLFVGALVAAILVVGITVVPMSHYPAQEGGLIGAPWERIRGTVLLVFVFAFICFSVGLLLVGIPSWVALHRRGLRGWRIAGILGVATTFAVSVAFSVLPLVFHPSNSTYSASDGGVATVINYHLTLFGWMEILSQSLQLAVIGGIVGWTIWRIAYRSITTGPVFDPTGSL